MSMLISKRKSQPGSQTGSKPEPAARRRKSANGEPQASLRDRILDTATTRFAEHGYGGCSMRDIAAELDVTPTSIYHHFKGKEALYQEVCFRRFALAAEHLSVAFDDKLTAEEQLLLFLEKLMVLLEGDRIYVRLVQQLLLERSVEDVRLLSTMSFLPQYKALQKLIVVASPKSNAGQAAFNLYTLALGYAQFRSVRIALPREIDVGQSPRELAQMIFASVLPESGRTKKTLSPGKAVKSASRIR